MAIYTSRSTIYEGNRGTWAKIWAFMGANLPLPRSRLPPVLPPNLAWF